ncbi:MAG: hypothetical protein IK130_12335 [Oscillospiraceae bacterium]|nr:hypothetical protein [Oscillospiraceae bacterium]
MKCRLCGAAVKRKNGHCTQCGAKIMRNPNEYRKNLFKLFLFFCVMVLAVIVFIVSMLIFDKAHQDEALLPGLYTGMTKQEMIQTLQRDYPAFSGGKQLRSTNDIQNSDGSMIYVSYSEYSKVLGQNRPMAFVATLFGMNNQQYLDTYSVVIPYVTDAESDGSSGNKSAVYDIQTKILPVLINKYGASEEAGGIVEYYRQFNFSESVTATDSKVSDLPEYEDALLKEFKGYEGTSFCVTITYAGNSFNRLRKTLFG